MYELFLCEFIILSLIYLKLQQSITHLGFCNGTIGFMEIYCIYGHLTFTADLNHQTAIFLTNN